jgi:uncharacterized membrane protein YuzA (DUF378 family)
MKGLKDLKELFLNLISATQGKGPSSTRLVYLMNGMVAVFCSLVMTIGGIEVYCAKTKADPVYWTAVGALWTATLGFGAKTKREQNQGAVQIAVAPHHSQIMPAPVQGD